MKAAIYNCYGGPDVVEITQLDVPTASKGQALIKVKAISLNPRDLALMTGKFKMFTGSAFPKFLGADFSGVIEEIPENKRGLKKGDPVFGYIQDLKYGASSAIASIPIEYLSRKPSFLSDEVACSLGCAYLTALQAIRNKAKAHPGQHILIYGASGGVGSAAVQLSKYFGCKVTAVSKSKNADYCMAQGADHFIAYDKQDPFALQNKYDVFFQVYSQEGNMYRKARHVLTDKGIFISLIPNPLYLFKKIFSKPAFDFLLVKNSTPDLLFLAELAKENKIQPHVDKVFQLSEMQSALELLENGNFRSKIVIRII